MNRRSFFATLAGVPIAVGPSMGTPNIAHEQQGAPICPSCGLHAMFLEPGWSMKVDRLVAVQCGCGWQGVAYGIRSIRSSPQGDGASE